MKKLNLQNLLFKDLSKEQVLSKDEEIELIKQIQLGNTKAREKLIKCNVSFVYQIAYRYYSDSINATVLDLVGDGIEGLMNAIDKYQLDYGIKFISYAVWWIRVFIVKAINEKYLNIRLPQNIRIQIEKELKKNNQNETIPSDVIEYMDMQYSCFSLDRYVDSNDSYTFKDCIEDTSLLHPDEIPITDYKVLEYIVNFLDSLTDLEKTVLENLYGIKKEKKTIKELSEEIHISTGQIRNIRDEAITHLKLKFKTSECSSELLNYLDKL